MIPGITGALQKADPGQECGLSKNTMWPKCSRQHKKYQPFDHNDKHAVELNQQKESH